MDIKGYARKHNPFISFKNIQNNKSRCAKIVNSKQLDKDIKSNSVPQFVFYTPNVRILCFDYFIQGFFFFFLQIDNDAHDTNMAYGSRWLKKLLSTRIKQKAFNKNTMFVVTFDEDDGASDNNKVLTILFGPDFHPSSNKKKDSTKYNHYSLLRTIEDNVMNHNIYKYNMN